MSGDLKFNRRYALVDEAAYERLSAKRPLPSTDPLLEMGPMSNIKKLRNLCAKTWPIRLKMRPKRLLRTLNYSVPIFKIWILCGLTLLAGKRVSGL